MITGIYILILCALFLTFKLLKVLHILSKKELGVIRFCNMTYAVTKY